MTTTKQPDKKTLDEIRDANLLLISSTSKLLAEADNVRQHRDRLLRLIDHMGDRQPQTEGQR